MIKKEVIDDSVDGERSTCSPNLESIDAIAASLAASIKEIPGKVFICACQCRNSVFGIMSDCGAYLLILLKCNVLT